MMTLGRKRLLALSLIVVATVFAWTAWESSGTIYSWSGSIPHPIASSVGDGHLDDDADDFVWRQLEPHFPIASFRTLPTGGAAPLPSIQAHFAPESTEQEKKRKSRQSAIKNAFVRCWETYKERAWLHDEVTPVTGHSRDTFGGWGATLVDSLDTLWIMGMRDEFESAVKAVAEGISFNNTDAVEINVFETTIRFLGGLLSAYDMSGDRRLLHKARDVGDMLYKAFDTPNHLPVTRWNPHDAANGRTQSASGSLLAELGSLSMEFTRLSLVTKDSKYYSAVQHISELLSESQMKTRVPGMWPIVLNAADGKFNEGNGFSFGAMSDSAYEYLPKMIAILGDSESIYRDMYEQSMEAAQKHLLYRPMVPGGDDVLFPGYLSAEDEGMKLETSGSHLACFSGGMLALGGRLISNESHVALGAKLTRGCVWAYSAISSGVMPETFHLSSCPNWQSSCEWDETLWHQAIHDIQSQGGSFDSEKAIEEQRLPPGFTKIPDSRYILRPEAIESVFIMYRITNDEFWREAAWSMWVSIEALTRTDLANTAVWNVNLAQQEDIPQADSMESFWMGETLKYFYLIFSEPDLVSLDEWVFNTEAHPFRQMR